MRTDIINYLEKEIRHRCERKENFFGMGIFYHIEAVVKNACLTAEQYGADQEIVMIASWLHDIASITDYTLYEEHHIYGAAMAKEILEHFHYDEKKSCQVQNCIKNHRGSVWVSKESPEECCVADADAASHFSSLPSLYYLAFVTKNNNLLSGTQFVRSKLKRSYQKLSEQGKIYYQESFEHIMKSMGSVQLLYGTSNPAKIEWMQKIVAPLDITLLSLADIKQEIPTVVEEGNTPLENAVQKAIAYYRAFGIPVFSCDSGLFLQGIPDELQPGVHVRTVNNKTLTDDEMITYYSGLAEKYGDLRARYCNAICLVLDEEHIYQAQEDSMAGDEFIITSKPHPVIREGFPLDSLSVSIKSGKYYMDLETENWEAGASKGALEEEIEEDKRKSEGFLSFFNKYI